MLSIRRKMRLKQLNLSILFIITYFYIMAVSIELYSYI